VARSEPSLESALFVDGLPSCGGMFGLPAIAAAAWLRCHSLEQVELLVRELSNKPLASACGAIFVGLSQLLESFTTRVSSAVENHDHGSLSIEPAMLDTASIRSTGGAVPRSQRTPTPLACRDLSFACFAYPEQFSRQSAINLSIALVQVIFNEQERSECLRMDSAGKPPSDSSATTDEPPGDTCTQSVQDFEPVLLSRVCANARQVLDLVDEFDDGTQSADVLTSISKQITRLRSQHESLEQESAEEKAAGSSSSDSASSRSMVRKAL